MLEYPTNTRPCHSVARGAACHQAARCLNGKRGGVALSLCVLGASTVDARMLLLLFFAASLRWVDAMPNSPVACCTMLNSCMQLGDIL